MILTCRYRLLPSKKQHLALEAILEAQRQLYNAALEERIEAFRKAGITRSYFDQAKALSQWRQEDADARSLPVNIQRGTLKRISAAYSAFFARVRRGGPPGFPRFRGKGWFDSFTFAQMPGLTIDGKRARFRGMPGALRIHLHRPLPTGQWKTCTFRRDTKGWVMCLAVEQPMARLRDAARLVGLDLGIKTFGALSDGTIIPSLKAARRAERRLRIVQRALQRKRRGSHARIKAKRALGREHDKVVRARLNHLHQASALLIKRYDVVAIERLNTTGLSRSGLGKELRDAGWGAFVRMLHYKAERAGVRIIQVDPDGTSQECSRCGGAAPKELTVRIHRCPQCGLSIDRVVNAARNILNRAGVGPGLRNVA